MPGFIKTEHDEELWAKAKESASKKFKHGSQSFWKYANATWHHMKGLKEEIGLAETIAEDANWEKCKEYIFNHPVYSEMSEDDKFESIDNALTAYNTLGNGQVQGLFEYIDSFSSYGGSNTNGLGGPNGLAAGGLGGGRTEPPKGPYVYGSPNYSLSDPMPGSSKYGDPAVVVIPDKKSTYKPWEQQLDIHGNDIRDVNRAQAVSAEDEEWNGPVGQVIRKLEDMGLDIDTLKDMSQEQLEDLLVKMVRQEQGQQSQQMREHISHIDGFRDKITEAFAYDNEFEEKLDLNGRIQKGRRFLADRLQKREALDKKDNKYVLSQYDIEKMLSGLGYAYSLEKQDWIEKEVAKKKEHHYVAPMPEPYAGIQTSSSPQILPVHKHPTAVVPEPVNTKSKVVNAFVNDEEKDPNKFHDPEVKKKIKFMEARFILGMAHGMPQATEFIEDEKSKEKIPVVADKDVIDKMEILKYTWFSDKMLWLDGNLSYPAAIFDNNENSKTIIARSFLASSGTENKIHVKETGKPSTSIDSIMETMTTKGYEWDSENNKWKYVGPVKEAVLYEAEEADLKPLKMKDQENKYNVVEMWEFQGRYLLRVLQLKEIKDSPRGAAQAALITKYMMRDNDPTSFKDYPRTTNPIMKFNTVQKELGARGYKKSDKGEIPIWTASAGANRVDKVLKDMCDDDEESFAARGILPQKDRKKSASYITITFDASTLNIEPEYSSAHIKDQIVKAMYMHWDESKSMWVQGEEADVFDSEGTHSSAVGLTHEKDDFVRRFQNTNWNYMSWADRDKYKLYSGEKMAMRELGMTKKDWPQGDDMISSLKRMNLMNKFKQNYKFKVSPNGEKGWVRRDTPVMRSLDKQGLKAAIGSVGRMLGTAGKAGGVVGSAAGKAVGSTLKDIINSTTQSLG